MEIKAAEQTAAQWRSAAGPGNPAGPLYASGAFAEADIIATEASYSHMGCSACTASHTIACC